MKPIALKLTILLGAMLVAFSNAGWADSGTFTMNYTKNNPIPVGDQEGHIIYLGEARGTAKGGWKNGGKVLIREYVDIVNGNGTHQGYVTVNRGAAKEVTKYSGKGSTTMNEDGTPNTTFGGNWTLVYGIGDFEQQVGNRGTYKGQKQTRIGIVGIQLDTTAAGGKGVLALLAPELYPTQDRMRQR